MTATNQDVAMFSGDTRVLAFTVTQAGDSTPVDLTGATAIKWKCARKLSGGFSSTVTLSKALGAGITVTDADAGQLQVLLSPADTAALSGRFYHELEITDVAGNVSTVAIGTLTIAKDLITAT
jgi:hypothetical protein